MTANPPPRDDDDEALLLAVSCSLLCSVALQYSHCSRKYSNRFVELICQGCCGCHLWHSCSDPDAFIVYLLPRNSEIPLRIDWKSTERNFSHLLNLPTSKQLFNRFSHWLQKNFYCLLITCTAIRHLLISRYKRPGHWTRDSGFDSRKEDKLFSSAQALKSMQPRFIPSDKGAEKSSGPHACR
jgi:hypothetical protein